MIHGETALEAMRAELSWLDHVIESNERDIIRAQEKCDQDVSTARRIIHESIEKSTSYAGRSRSWRPKVSNDAGVPLLRRRRVPRDPRPSPATDARSAPIRPTLTHPRTPTSSVTIEETSAPS